MDLSDAYSIAAHTPGWEGFPPRWAIAAEGFRKRLGPRARLDIAYGRAERQKYDLFLPEASPRGTLVFVHGGYWKAFDAKSWSHLAAGPLSKGWAVAMPSYDLCPDVRIGQISSQIASALQAVAAETEGPISLTGHSAGGHLVARMLDPALTPASLASRLQHVVPISPLSDLRPLLQTSMNDELQLTEAEAQAESPLLMARRHPVPVTVWVGADERPALLDQSAWLAKAWNVDRVVVPDKHHFDVIDALADPQSDLVARLTS